MKEEWKDETIKLIYDELNHARMCIARCLEWIREIKEE